MSVPTNAHRLVRTRLLAVVAPANIGRSVAPDGRSMPLPGSGGVVLGVALGSPAGGWAGDHVEPGLSLAHPDPLALTALRRLSCVGNPVRVLDGPAAGATGMVYGKHGPVLAMLAEADLARTAPGERVAIEAHGVGLEVEGEPDLVCQSCSPALFEAWITQRRPDGRLMVPVAAVLPPVAAAAGIGMPSAMFNIDLNTSLPPVADLARALRFGDIVAVLGQDHRHGRRPAGAWVAVGVISHGQTVGGGHGFGMMTLLTAPEARLDLVVTPDATLNRLMEVPA